VHRPLDQAHPFATLLAHRGVVVLDGGLATALEGRGHDLRDLLWSARLLLDAPEEITAVHRAFLEAGADCLTTASYQATLQGFAAAGHPRAVGADALVRSVALATEAVADFLRTEAGAARVARPLVAASVGPYGAYLADGSEYVGRYAIGRADLRDFHAERFRLLAGAGADLLACETIPSVAEAEALLDLLDDAGSAWAWLTFTCLDGRRISDGTPFVDAVRLCEGHARVAAVGVNCTAPEHVEELVRVARTATDLPIVVYPNSGERYDPSRKKWVAPRSGMGSATAPWLEAAERWVAAGASMVGGCCRVGPETIRALRGRLLG